MGKRIKMLHVHNNDPYHDAHLAPFMGKIDWLAAYRIPAPAREDLARLLVKTAHTLLDMME